MAIDNEKLKKLQVIMKLKENAENQAKESYLKAKEHTIQCDMQLISLKEYAQEYKLNLEKKGVSGLSANEWKQYQTFLENLKVTIEAAQCKLVKAHELEAMALREYQIAMTDKKIIENVYQKRAYQHHLALSKQEQKALDEMAVNIKQIR